MKRPTVVRDRILARTVDMLEHLRLQVSMWLPDEHEVLLALNRPNQFEIAAELAKHLFERLGGEVTNPKEPRFDKTRRALAKKRGRPPRGMSKAELAALEPQSAT